MIERSLGTHDGSFHADEVTACALLIIFELVDREKIHRTRDPDLLAKCEFVCDVGGEYDPAKKRFDHHQVEYTGELSSAGMVWQYLLEEKIIDESLYHYVNRAIIIGVDGHDNGRVMQEEGVCTFSHVIANFVPTEYDAEEGRLNAGFSDALDFTIGHFSRLIERYAYIASCRDKVWKAMKSREKKLIFDEPLPWLENFFDLDGENHPALFVIMPSGGQWKLRGIPPTREDRMGLRMPLPKRWAGLRDEDLKEVTGIDGAIFCHKERFISIWETKEDALKALNLILGEEE